MGVLDDKGVSLRRLLAGEVVYYDVVRAADLKVALSGLDDKGLFCLSEYLGDLGVREGVPGLLMGMATVEAAQRFNAGVVQGFNAVTGAVTSAEDYPAGATTAEGIDSGLRGEKI